MREPVWRLAVIDSGVRRREDFRVRGARRFVDVDGRVMARAVEPDRAGHGTMITRIIASAGEPVEFLIGQVLDEAGRCTAAALAAAVDWALERRAHLVHLSLGLRADRPVLADAIARAVQAGLVIVCAAPAQGPPVYPAAYGGVIRATGDARCGRDDLSALDTVQADFGACVADSPAPAPEARGASIGAAHVSRFVVRHIEPGQAVTAVREKLAALARYRGPERRAAAAPGAASAA